MNNSEKKICIIGTGGMGREILSCIEDCLASTKLHVADIACFMETDRSHEEEEIMGVPVIPFTSFASSMYEVIVAIGNPIIRKKVVQSLPPDVEFRTLIHPSVIISSKWSMIGKGSFIGAGSILTTGIRIGAHAQLNLATTIGHDCHTGDYFTTAHGVHLSGNCHLGNQVYLGSGASVRQGISICDDVTIGMGGIVVKNITEPGIYTGIPVKQQIS